MQFFKKTIILFVLLSFACQKRAGDRINVAAVDRQASEVVVRTVQLQIKDVDERVDLPAIVEPWDDTEVVFQSSGTVVDIQVTEGEMVEKDQLLVLLDDRIQLAELQRATTARDQAERDYQRMGSLYESGSVSQQEYESARQGYEAAVATFNRSSENWEYTRLRAPFDGRIDRLDVRVGLQVSIGSKAVYMLSSGRLRANLAIPESDVTYVRAGNLINFSYERFNSPPLQFSGRILSVAAQVEENSRSYRALASIDDPEGLRSGMVLEASLLRTRHSGVITIPIFALVPSDDTYSLFIEKENIAEEREVKLGAFIGTDVIITQGLEPGEKLVVEGQQFLSAGTRIKEL